MIIHNLQELKEKKEKINNNFISKIIMKQILNQEQLNLTSLST